MSLKNIKFNSQAQRGFTIVELLIVVVVIAILAAITIVSYNGITNRANQSSAKSTASTLQKKIELYYSEVGNYPISGANLSGDSSKSYYTPSGTFGSIAPTADKPSSGTNTKGTGYVQLFPCFASGTTASTAPTTSNITGIRINYWTYGDDGATAASKEFTTIGTCAVVGTSTTAYN